MKMVRELVRRLKEEGDKMISEDGPREMVRSLKDGKKVVIGDGPRVLARRLKKDGEKMVGEDGL